MGKWVKTALKCLYENISALERSLLRHWRQSYGVKKSINIKITLEMKPGIEICCCSLAVNTYIRSSLKDSPKNQQLCILQKKIIHYNAALGHVVPPRALWLSSSWISLLMSTTNTAFDIFKDNIGNWNPLYSDLYVKFSNNEDRFWLKM